MLFVPGASREWDADDDAATAGGARRRSPGQDGELLIVGSDRFVRNGTRRGGRDGVFLRESHLHVAAEGPGGKNERFMGAVGRAESKERVVSCGERCV